MNDAMYHNRETVIQMSGPASPQAAAFGNMIAAMPAGKKITPAAATPEPKAKESDKKSDAVEKVDKKAEAVEKAVTDKVDDAKEALLDDLSTRLGKLVKKAKEAEEAAKEARAKAEAAQAESLRILTAEDHPPILIDKARKNAVKLDLKAEALEDEAKKARSEADDA